MILSDDERVRRELRERFPPRPGGVVMDDRWTFIVCPDCGGLRSDVDHERPHPAWPLCTCHAP